MIDILPQLLFALVAVILTGRLLAKAFAYVGQPPVIGEVVAGILLGPSLIGSELSARILPESVAPLLGTLAQLGVILYMFLVGIELNASQLRSRGVATFIIAQSSIIVPFGLGAALAGWLQPTLSSAEVPVSSFALFMGVAMSITAFPVLTVIAPAFFAYTGMQTQIGLVSGLEQWLLVGVIIAVATVGKFGSTALAARLTGLDWRTSSALGCLMNTRALMELIAFNIGRELNIISPTLFAMMVLMALITTMATTPMLTLLCRRPPDGEDRADVTVSPAISASAS